MAPIFSAPSGPKSCSSNWENSLYNLIVYKFTTSYLPEGFLLLLPFPDLYMAVMIFLPKDSIPTQFLSHPKW